MKTRILLDNGIMSHRTRMQWNKIPVRNPLGGFIVAKLIVAERVPPFPKPEQEAEAEAILTVGRLIRERHIAAFTSMELRWEGIRDYFGVMPFDALQGCDIGSAPNPIERGKFVQTELERFIRKGGKKDRCECEDGASQIHFFDWLRRLEPAAIERIIHQKQDRGLTDFECESFRDLEWFKTLAQRLRSDENLPDAFHLWTTKRNALDVFLTLDFKLIKQAESIEREKSGFRLGFRVRSPIGFLHDEGIDSPDPYPCVAGRHYTMAELPPVGSGAPVP